MSQLREIVASLQDDDREGLQAALAQIHVVNVFETHAYAMGIVQRRPITAMRLLSWLIHRVQEPTEADVREEWLRAHNNACYLAVFHGEDDERRVIVDKALSVARHNIAIYHNAACVLCKLGDGEGALEAIRRGVEQGYDEATIASIRNDDDLALIRDLPEFLTILEGRGEVALPAWAEGYTAAEYTQFREAVRTTLPDPDMSTFEEGTVASDGRVFDLRDLARECRGKSAMECTQIVHRHFHSRYSN